MKRVLFLFTACLFTFTIMQGQKNKSYHTFLGVDVNNINLKTNGLYVNGVYRGFGAEKAGLRPGDSLKLVNADAVRTFDELVKTLDKYEPGEQVELTYTRNNAFQKTTAILSEYPEFLKYSIWDNVEGEGEIVIRKPMLGIHVESMWEEYGLLVTGFTDNSAAREAGIKIGDVIMKMDNYEFVSLEELKYYLSKYQPGATTNLTIKRDGQSKSIQVILGEEVIYINNKKVDKKKKDQ